MVGCKSTIESYIPLTPPTIWAHPTQVTFIWSMHNKTLYTHPTCNLWINLHRVGLCSAVLDSVCAVKRGSSESENIKGNWFQPHAHPFPCSFLCFNSFRTIIEMPFEDSYPMPINTLFSFFTYDSLYQTHVLISRWHELNFYTLKQMFFTGGLIPFFLLLNHRYNSWEIIMLEQNKTTMG